MISRSTDNFLKKKRKKNRINFIRVCPIPTLEFCMNKHIVGSIDFFFYKHICTFVVISINTVL